MPPPPPLAFGPKAGVAAASALLFFKALAIMRVCDLGIVRMMGDHDLAQGAFFAVDVVGTCLHIAQNAAVFHTVHLPLRAFCPLGIVWASRAGFMSPQTGKLHKIGRRPAGRIQPFSSAASRFARVFRCRLSAIVNISTSITARKYGYSAAVMFWASRPNSGGIRQVPT